MMSPQFERYIMSAQANFFAIFNVDFSIINNFITTRMSSAYKQS